MTPPVRRARPGYVLIVVLLVIVVLTLAAYRFAEAMTSEYGVAVRSTEAAEAKAFAISGVHYAAGALADPATVSGTLGGNPTDAPALGGISVGPDGGPFGGGRFGLFTVGDTFTGTGEGRYVVRNGVTDEGSKLNVNALIQFDPTGQVMHDALMKLPNMTEDIADALVDWVDPDDTQRAAGAETAYYTGMGTPYLCKNGPANTLDELLYVRGITPQLLFGTDRNRNGRMDSGETDGGDFNRGWSEFLTVYGRELDVDTAGNPRVSLSDLTADPTILSEDLTVALGQEMSDYILWYMLGGTTAAVPGTTTATPAAATTTGTSTGGTTTGAAGSTSSTGTGATGSTSATGTTTSGSTTTTGATSTTSATGSSTTTAAATAATGTAADLAAAVQQKLAAATPLSKKVASVMALYNTRATLPVPAGAAANTPAPYFPCPMNDPNTLKTLLPVLLDTTTPRTGVEMIPRVNVNTAPPEVLTALPGLTPDDVTAITTARGSLAPDDPAAASGAWLVTTANLTPTAFQALEKYVTGRSMTYRVQSVGYFATAGSATARVEAVIDTNQGKPRIVYFRDLTDLGRGFELPR